MAKSRQLKGRIRSVQNTRKITKTMELVATSKLKRAQDRVIAARPYADALRQVIADLYTPDLAEGFPLLRKPAPPSKGGPSRAAVILLTSNRGLARRVQLQPDQGSPPSDRGAREGRVHRRAPGNRQEGNRLLQVSGPQARAGAGRHRRPADHGSCRRDRGAPDPGLLGGGAGQRRSDPGPLPERLTDASGYRSRPSRRSSRGAGGQRGRARA